MNARQLIEACGGHGAYLWPEGDEVGVNDYCGFLPDKLWKALKAQKVSVLAELRGEKLAASTLSRSERARVLIDACSKAGTPLEPFWEDGVMSVKHSPKISKRRASLLALLFDDVLPLLRQDIAHNAWMHCRGEVIAVMACDSDGEDSL
jgi:hypothetical protein